MERGVGSIRIGEETLQEGGQRGIEKSCHFSFRTTTAHEGAYFRIQPCARRSSPGTARGTCRRAQTEVREPGTAGLASETLIAPPRNGQPPIHHPTMLRP